METCLAARPWAALESIGAYDTPMTIDPRIPRHIEVMDDETTAIMRAMSPAEKIAMASDMWKSASEMIFYSLRESNPHWDESMLHREVARRMSRGAT
jgi:hypothetical protein